MAETPKRDDVKSLPDRLVADPKNPPELTLLQGWLGASSEAGHRRLYLDPQLSQSMEIPEDAIVHSQDMPAASNPLGGQWVWVKAEAAIKQGPGIERLYARFLRGQIQQDFLATTAAGTGTGLVGAQIGPIAATSPALCTPVRTVVNCPTQQISCRTLVALQCTSSRLCLTRPIVCNLNTSPALCTVSAAAICPTRICPSNVDGCPSAPGGCETWTIFEQTIVEQPGVFQGGMGFDPGAVAGGFGGGFAAGGFVGAPNPAIGAQIVNTSPMVCQQSQIIICRPSILQFNCPTITPALCFTRTPIQCRSLLVQACPTQFQQACLTMPPGCPTGFVCPPTVAGCPPQTVPPGCPTGFVCPQTVAGCPQPSMPPGCPSGFVCPQTIAGCPSGPVCGDPGTIVQTDVFAQGGGGGFDPNAAFGAGGGLVGGPNVLLQVTTPALCTVSRLIACLQTVTPLNCQTAAPQCFVSALTTCPTRLCTIVGCQTSFVCPTAAGCPTLGGCPTFGGCPSFAGCPSIACGGGFPGGGGGGFGGGF